MADFKQNYFQRRTKDRGPRSNNRITSSEVQVITNDGDNLGILNTNEAISKAKEEGLISGDVFILRRFLTGALSWSKTWFNTKGDLSIDTLAQEALRLVFKP